MKPNKYLLFLVFLCHSILCIGQNGLKSEIDRLVKELNEAQKKSQTSNDDFYGANANSSNYVNKTAPELIGASSSFVQTLTIGIAKVIVSKAQDEVVTSFMEGLGNNISENELEKFTTLIPNVKQTLDLIKFDLVNYKAHLPAIQGAAQQDFKNLEYTIPVFIDAIDSTLIGWSQKQKLKAASVASVMLLNGNDIKTVITFLEKDLDKFDKEASAFSSLEAKTEVIKEGEIEEKITLISEILSPAYTVLLSIPYGASDNIEEQRRYFSAVMNIIKSSSLFKIKENKVALNFLECLTSSYFEIRNNSIAYGVSRALQGVNLIIEEEIKAEKEKDKEKESLQKAVKWLTFLSNITTVESGDQMATLIKSTALSTGSYRLKRTENSQSVFINSYIGGSVGYEKFINSANETGGAVYGMSAPVGISFNPFQKFGIFVPFIDVGNYLTFVNTDNVEDLPEITLSNIFSPGLFIEYKVPNIFLSISGGIKYGPHSRLINQTSNRSYTKEINASIDLPLYLIYKK